MKNIYLLLRFFIFICKENILEKVNCRRKPRVLQMPITNRCNSRCLTCNVWKEDKDKLADISAKKLRQILKQDYFSKVSFVGLNGGEFTLNKTSIDVVDSVLMLPNIKSLNMISNGIYTTKLIEYMIIIAKKCRERGVFLSLTLSIDGTNDIQKKVRGVPGAWYKTMETLAILLKDTKKYCDRLGIGCTISRYNVAYLMQTDEYLSQYNIPVEYHLAVPNKRIGTFSKADFSVLSDETSRMLAIEFFYRKMNSEKTSIDNSLRYYLQIKYLENKGKGRMALCSFRNQDVTIDEKLNMYLCATASDVIGNLNNDTASVIINSKKCKKIQSDICKECTFCIHYTYYPSIKGFFSFIEYKLKNKHSFVINKFKFLLKW